MSAIVKTKIVPSRYQAEKFASFTLSALIGLIV